MENQVNNNYLGHKTSAKDFFLHLSAQVSLYAILINLINLLFRIINKSYPQLDYYNYYYFGESNISFPVALIIIVFPIFIVLSYFIEKSFQKDPDSKNVWIRKWLVYLTIFISGILVAGNLVTVLYYFLDGQELTMGFLMKVLVLVSISICVFVYYLGDIREKNSTKTKKISAVLFALTIIASISLGFSVLGSPKTQRLKNEDETRVNNLITLKNNIDSYYTKYKSLPKDLEQIKDVDMYYNESRYKLYKYEKISEKNYKLCTEFKLEGNRYKDMVQSSMAEDQFWYHTKGENCFELKANDYSYPVEMPKI